MDFLEVVRQRVVISDGAMGTSLHARDLSEDDYGGPQFEGCPEILNDTRPDVVAEIHASFYEVGADVVETNAFGAFSTVLQEYGIPERSHELSFKAATIAKDVAASFSTPEKPRWVAGNLGPGTKLPSLGQIRFVPLRDAYEESAHGLVEGGVDLIIIETVYDLLQAKAAVAGARRAMRRLGRSVPIQLQVTVETTGRMLVGSEIGAALTSLAPLQPDVLGLNCATGPREMTEHLRHL
ncbi:MAG: homocysteine S-methyltransferase family protein, partial [Actinomycetota bacterium]